MEGDCLMKKDKINNILYLKSYNSYWIYDDCMKVHNPEFDDFSSKILNFKKRDRHAVGFFYSVLFNIFSDLPDRENIVLVAVPSHTSAGGCGSFEEVIDKLCNALGFINGKMCLKRVATIQKLSHGGRRNKNIHMQTIKVDKINILKGKKVILLDDVTTTGNSMLACEDLLRGLGVSGICKFALAKTKSSHRKVSNI